MLRILKEDNDTSELTLETEHNPEYQKIEEEFDTVSTSSSEESSSFSDESTKESETPKHAMVSNEVGKASLEVILTHGDH